MEFINNCRYSQNLYFLQLCRISTNFQNFFNFFFTKLQNFYKIVDVLQNSQNFYEFVGTLRILRILGIRYKLQEFVETPGIRRNSTIFKHFYEFVEFLRSAGSSAELWAGRRRRGWGGDGRGGALWGITMVVGLDKNHTPRNCRQE